MKIKVAFPFHVVVKKVIQVKTQHSKGLLSCCGFPQLHANGWRPDELFSSGEQQGNYILVLELISVECITDIIITIIIITIYWINIFIHHPI